MKTRKPKIGGRYVAWMRGAFSRPRLAVSGAGRRDKPEAKASAVDATRANGGATAAKRPTNPGVLPGLFRRPVERLQILAS